MNGEKVEQRRVPDPYDPIFARRHTGKFVGLKSSAWINVKEQNRGTTFFDDLVWARKHLLLAADIIEPLFLTNHYLDSSIWEVHPLLKPSEAQKIYKQLKDEANFMVEIWHKYVAKEYKLPIAISKRYEKVLLDYRPDFRSTASQSHKAAFMPAKDRNYVEYVERVEELKNTKLVFNDDLDDAELPSWMPKATHQVSDGDNDDIELVDD